MFVRLFGCSRKFQRLFLFFLFIIFIYFFVLETPIVVSNLFATVSNLEACESYLFNVGLVKPLGVGPLSPPLLITTSFNKNAPPKKLSVKPHPKDENSMIIQWESSCKVVMEPIGYEVRLKYFQFWLSNEFIKKKKNFQIVVTEINLNKSSSVTLLPKNDTKFEHTFNTHFGGRYSIVVSTTADKSIPSLPVYYDAPEILPPHQVQVLINGSSFYVLWRQKELPESLESSS